MENYEQILSIIGLLDKRLKVLDEKIDIVRKQVDNYRDDVSTLRHINKERNKDLNKMVQAIRDEISEIKQNL